MGRQKTYKSDPPAFTRPDPDGPHLMPERWPSPMRPQSLGMKAALRSFFERRPRK
jgi:hypothetical protein